MRFIKAFLERVPINGPLMMKGGQLEPFGILHKSRMDYLGAYSRHEDFQLAAYKYCKTTVGIWFAVREALVGKR